MPTLVEKYGSYFSTEKGVSDAVMSVKPLSGTNKALVLFRRTEGTYGYQYCCARFYLDTEGRLVSNWGIDRDSIRYGADNNRLFDLLVARQTGALVGEEAMSRILHAARAEFYELNGETALDPIDQSIRGLFLVIDGDSGQ